MKKKVVGLASLIGVGVTLGLGAVPASADSGLPSTSWDKKTKCERTIDGAYKHYDCDHDPYEYKSGDIVRVPVQCGSSSDGGYRFYGCTFEDHVYDENAPYGLNIGGVVTEPGKPFDTREEAPAEPTASAEPKAEVKKTAEAPKKKSVASTTPKKTGTASTKVSVTILPAQEPIVLPDRPTHYGQTKIIYRDQTTEPVAESKSEKSNTLTVTKPADKSVTAGVSKEAEPKAESTSVASKKSAEVSTSTDSKKSTETKAEKTEKTTVGTADKSSEAVAENKADESTVTKTETKAVSTDDNADKKAEDEVSALDAESTSYEGALSGETAEEADASTKRGYALAGGLLAGAAGALGLGTFVSRRRGSEDE